MRDFMNIAEGLTPDPSNPNAYWFRFVEPTEVYEAVGLSDSNTWIGRSRAITTVFRKRTVGPNDLFAFLPGGLFLVEDGMGKQIKFVLPKPPLEKSYGELPESKRAIERLGEQGKIETAERYTGPINWRPELLRLPELHPQLID